MTDLVLFYWLLFSFGESYWEDICVDEVEHNDPKYGYQN
jgi:hypothetical protein